MPALNAASTLKKDQVKQSPIKPWPSSMAEQGMAAAPSEQGGGGLGQSNEIVQIH